MKKRRNSQQFNDDWFFDDGNTGGQSQNSPVFTPYNDNNNNDDFWGDGDNYQPKKRRSRGRRNQTGLIIGICAAVLALVVVAGVVLVGLGSGESSVSISGDKNVTQPVQDVPIQRKSLPTESRYFRNRLNTEQQNAYDQVLLCVLNHDLRSQIFTLTNLTDLNDIVSYIKLDWPEIFWLDQGEYEYTDQSGSYNVVFKPKYTYSAQESANYLKVIDDVVDPLVVSLAGASEYDKVVGVYTFLVEYFAYDLKYTGTDIYQNIKDRRSVCEGYARLTQYALQKLGMEVFFVEGTGKSEAHAWNIVKVDGAYYHVDTTWGDPLIDDGTQVLSYAYCLVPDEQIMRTHSYTLEGKDLSSRYPACTSTDANYFVRESLLVYNYDEGFLGSFFAPVLEKPSEVTFQCIDKATYDTHMQKLFNEKRLQEIVRSIDPQNKIKGFTYRYDNDMYTITIYFEQ